MTERLIGEFAGMQGTAIRHALMLMREERWEITVKISRTPRWQVIRRYRLLDRWYKLDESIGLIEHVTGEDQ